MSMMLAIREAEKTAELVLEEHRLFELPICPFHIAKKVGIVVGQKELASRGVSGVLVRVGDMFGIMYATHIVNDGFVRFTVAHELGHYFIPGHAEQLFPNGKSSHQSRSGYVSNDPLERQADHFASSLLMPESLFKQVMRRCGQGLPAVQTLAHKCNTSLTATAIRYAQFTDDAVAVIVSTGDRINYCIMSDTIRELKKLPRIKKGDPLPADTETAKFNSDSDNVTRAKRAEGASSLDDWFDGAPQIEMNEDVIGLGSYGKTLTILYAAEWPDEDDDEDDDDD